MNCDEHAIERPQVTLEDERRVGSHEQRLKLEGELGGIGGGIELP
jgi:hypothetical protein